MAEEYARNRQYEYRANSNLVLEADRETRRIRDEATGEVESLWGKMEQQKMGDKVTHRLERKRTALKSSEPAKRKRVAEDPTLELAGYAPKTKESRKAFEELLALTRSALGDAPDDVLRGAAEEVLFALKEQKPAKDVAKLLGLSEVETTKRYGDLERVVSRIADVLPGGGGGGGGTTTTSNMTAEEDKLDEETGVAVVFDDDESGADEENNNNDVDEVASEEEDDDAAGGVEATRESRLLGRGDLDGGQDGQDDHQLGEDDVLDVNDIDAHWLQRELGKFYDDANVSANLAADVLELLEGSDVRDVENRLVMLLDYDKFDFIKLLLTNRKRIFYCVTLKQAQSNDARDEIKNKMFADAPEVFDALFTKRATAETWAADRAADFATRTRKEAVGLTKQQLEDTTTTTAANADSLLLGKARVNDDDDRDLDDDDESRNNHRKRRLNPSRVVDLSSLTFARGGHTMSNKRCELPASAWRAQKKGYEEVHVPALLNEERGRIPLVPIASLPEWARHAFQGMKTLNTIQSKLLPAAFETSENLLLCAPTGAGKTNCAVLTMLNQFAAYRMDPSDPSSVKLDVDAFKVVYVAPMKALVQEVVLNFSKRLAPYGITVRELSGDQSLTYAQIAETQVIVTTPEKWDIITRKSGDRAYTQLVRLVIVDEIHLLHDDRGPVLESIVARTVRQIEATRQNVRLVGLSATLPNYRDVASLLRVDEEKGLFFFDNSFRPVPLQQQYIGVTEKKAVKRFQLMNEICFEKVLAQAGKNNQVLIFVHSRAETVKTATALKDMALERDVLSRFVREDSATREILQEETETAKADALKELLPYGFAIHHAGMTRSDRNLVEDLFADKHIQVLCSTATLAWGVNLPAHTVIIKGTQIYSPEEGKWTELSPLDIVQMMGRAGRPQFDSEGEGIILTKHSELQYYLSLMNQQLPVESQLASKLPDHLNAEIEMGTVTDVHEAADWLSYTYWNVRASKDPDRYGVEGGGATGDDGSSLLRQHRLDVAHSAALVLDRHNLVKYDTKTGTFQITALGRVAAHYYVSYESMASYNEHLKPTMSDIELFRLFASSGEFKQIHVREEEKMELAKLATRVPIPIKESADEPSAKINALLQAYISNLKLEGFALVADMTFVKQSAARLCRALFEIALRRKWASLAHKALTLCKMVERRLWQSQSPLRQFKGVPETIVRKLEKKEIAWDRFYDLKPQDLGELVKLPKMGKTLHRLVHQVPRLELSAHVQPISRGLLRIEVVIVPDFRFDPNVHDYAQLFHVVVEDVDGEKILHHEPFLLRQTYAEEEHYVDFAVAVSDPLPPQYFLKVTSDRWLHSTATLPISFKHLILPRKYPPHTDLLDLQPLPIAGSLGHEGKDFEGLFFDDNDNEDDNDNDNEDDSRRRRSFFNPIQTQAFAALYESDENVLLCAPKGSGKVVCAEFAVVRALVAWKKKNRRGTCVVYAAPKEATVKRRKKEWSLTFEKRFGVAVAELTGDVAADLKTMASAEIVVTTAAKWDVLSRRWKQRKAVQRVALFIADDLHFLGSPIEGPTLEIVVSRMRYVASQLDEPPRLVGLAASLADAKDVGDWIGADKPGATCFSFHSNVRPTPLELYLHTFDTPHYAARLLAMGKVLLQVLERHTPKTFTNFFSASTKEEPPPLFAEQQALVFVSSRKQCQLTAIDVMVHFAAIERDQLKVREEKKNDDDDEVMEDAGASKKQVVDDRTLSGIVDPALRQTLGRGVAFLHPGLAKSDAATVEALYRRGQVAVLVAPAEACWDMTLAAYLVVVVGTERYDGREHRYVDYPPADVLEMLGKAAPHPSSTSNDQGAQQGAKCAVFCHTPKKEYLRRLLYDPLPVESQLDRSLHDHVNAEIVSKTIENKQDAVDYLTWTFYYRRLTQNPNFYDVQGATNRHVSDHLSELVENVIGDLEESKCVAVDDDVDVSPLNLGMIAAYYNIQYTTVELFASSVGAKTKIPALLEILASAAEIAAVPTRFGEDKALGKLAKHLPRFKPPSSSFAGKRFSDDAEAAAQEEKKDFFDDDDAANKGGGGLYGKAEVKALVLLHSHFARQPLSSSELGLDRDAILQETPRLLQALVDVISSNGWLSSALHVMELSQMVVQALWFTENALLQIPHVDGATLGRVEEEQAKDPANLQIDGVFDVLALDDDVRDRILAIDDPARLAEVAAFCNDYPNVELAFQVKDARLRAGDPGAVVVKLEREVDDDMTDIGRVRAPRFPVPKKEAWWLLVADVKNNALLSIKRLTLAQHANVTLDFAAPNDPGTHTLTLIFMCDSYLGCDQEYEFSIDVLPEEAPEDVTMKT
mmetsp:Transcript_10155/g.33224  ORF Transcript_10155/g.33224 Transcript_10155/m.33224 type:complete len:2313 (+) Transcript_10155:39-6977(+)